MLSYLFLGWEFCDPLNYFINPCLTFIELQKNLDIWVKLFFIAELSFNHEKYTILFLLLQSIFAINSLLFKWNFSIFFSKYFKILHQYRNSLIINRVKKTNNLFFLVCICVCVGWWHYYIFFMFIIKSKSKKKLERTSSKWTLIYSNNSNIHATLFQFRFAWLLFFIAPIAIIIVSRSRMSDHCSATRLL